jgi:hypothetical protein
MTQTLRIFRKDVRHLAPFILVILALQTTLAIAAVQSVGIVGDTQRIDIAFALCESALPLAWVFLIAMLVLQDPLAGENAFHLTPPYSWLSLFTSKVFFTVISLNLPLFLSDILILNTLGLSFHFSELFWRQLPELCFFTIPAVAISGISRSLIQFSLFLFTLVNTRPCT